MYKRSSYRVKGCVFDARRGWPRRPISFVPSDLARILFAAASRSEPTDVFPPPAHVVLPPHLLDSCARCASSPRRPFPSVQFASASAGSPVRSTVSRTARRIVSAVTLATPVWPCPLAASAPAPFIACRCAAWSPTLACCVGVCRLIIFVFHASRRIAPLLPSISRRFFPSHASPMPFLAVRFARIVVSHAFISFVAVPVRVATCALRPAFG